VRNSFKFIGKGATLLAASSLLMAMTAVIPAEAAVKAGDRCSKANATIRISGERFVCTKNPATKSSRLIWVWNDCLVTHRAYREGLTSQKELEETAAKTISMLKMDIEGIRAQIASNEAEAKTWDAKVVDYTARAAAETSKAAELKASAAKGGITSVDPKFKSNLQVALFDKKLTSAEVTQLATSWGTTVDKVPFIIEFISAEDRLQSARSYTLGAKNAERKAASLRSADLIELKNRQIRSAESNVSLGKAQLSSLLSTRKSACSPSVWRSLT
jgi:hypothetical protein